MAKGAPMPQEMPDLNLDKVVADLTTDVSKEMPQVGKKDEMKDLFKLDELKQ